MNDSSKDCKIYILHFFTLYDPLISNFALTPPIENSKMPDKIHENYVFAKSTFLTSSNNQSMLISVLMFSYSMNRFYDALCYAGQFHDSRIYLSFNTTQFNNMLNVGREIRPVSRYPHGDFIAKYSRPL